MSLNAKPFVGGAKHCDQLNSEPSPTRKARFDLQVCAVATPLKMASDAIVTVKCLWRRCCSVLQNKTFLAFNHAKLPEIEYKSPVYSSTVCNNIIFVRNWIFLSISLKKNKYRSRLNPSNNLCVALSNCVSRYERIISEKQQKKSLGKILISSKVWKLNSTLSAFCCVVSRPIQARNYGSADGAKPPWKKFRSPLEKCVRHSSRLLYF